MALSLLIPCMECFQVDGHPSEFYSTLPLQETGPYKTTCPKGHQVATALQEQHFQMLFELGLHAIIDGYYREAVADFASALERFYEFYVLMAWNRQGISPDVASKAWKKVSQQSERQFGLFIGVYVEQTKQFPRTLSDEDIKFRNGVIHKGKIPTAAEAMKFGQEVADTVIELSTDIAPNDFIFQHLLRQQAAGSINATLSYPATLKVGGKRTLDIEIEIRRIEQSAYLRPPHHSVFQ